TSRRCAPTTRSTWTGRSRSTDRPDVRVVAAPNPYKGSLGAPAAARAMALGIHDVFRDAEVPEVPLADGGEGTVEGVVAARAGGPVNGPRGTALGRPA